jgi:hypothetical protein
MLGKLLSGESYDDEGGRKMRGVRSGVFHEAVACIENPQRPSTEGMNNPLVKLMKRCWAHFLSECPKFAEIVRGLEKDENLFEGTDRGQF